jgi:hypothetical protein
MTGYSGLYREMSGGHDHTEERAKPRRSTQYTTGIVNIAPGRSARRVDVEDRSLVS